MKALDYLGGWKWPSIAAITLMPLGSYFLLDWGGESDPVAEVMLGPEIVDDRPVVLSRPAEPGSHEWCARSCPTCWSDVRQVSLAYGTATGANAWTEATASRGRLCAELDPPAPGATHLWVRVRGPEGEEATRLALDAAT